MFENNKVHLTFRQKLILKMTRSSEDNMNSVAGEVNQMDVDYGKNFKILLPNDQIKGGISIASTLFVSNFSPLAFIHRASNNLARQEHKQK